MAQAILRIKKLKTMGSLTGLGEHLERSRETPNADPELAAYNARYIGSGNLNQDVQNRIENSGCKVRKDSVLAVEHFMSASPEFFSMQKVKGMDGKAVLTGDIERWKEFEKRCADWLTTRYGKENIVNFTVHLDENSPHIHAVVVPVVAGKLNCKSYCGGREKMREMQDSFAKAHEPSGIERGIRGSRATHTEVRQFYELIKPGQAKGMSQQQIEAQLARLRMLEKENKELKATAKQLQKENEKLKDREKLIIERAGLLGKGKITVQEFQNSLLPAAQRKSLGR